MSFLKDVLGVAAPIVGSAFGPAGTAIGSAIGGLMSTESQEGAARKATQQQLQAIEDAKARTEQGIQTAQGFFSPLTQVGQRGVDLAGFLADPQAQARMAQQNPLFDLSRRLMTEDINQSAAARGRLTAGDTLERLQMAGVQAAQPLIDRQRQDIFNLLNIAGTTAGQQAGIEQLGTQQIVDLITGGGATQAAGTVAGSNARQGFMGNLFDIGQTLGGNQDVQDFVGSIFGSGGTTPPPGFGG